VVFGIQIKKLFQWNLKMLVFPTGKNRRAQGKITRAKPKTTAVSTTYDSESAIPNQARNTRGKQIKPTSLQHLK